VALPLFVAVDNGYFAERGVDVELVRINTSNDLGTAGTLGRVDFMMPCALNVIFDIANVSGVRHRLFGLNVYSDKPPNVADYLLVRKDSPVHTIRELRGKRIAGHPGSATQIVIKLIMEKESIPADGYAFVPLQPAEWGPALSSGAIDAVAALEPEASQLMVSGIARSIVDGFYAKLMPDLPLSGWWVSAGYTERSGTSQVIQAVIDGYRRAVAYIETNPDSAKLHFKNYVPIREDALPRMQLNKWLTPETIDLATVQPMVDLFAANRVIQARVSVDSFLVR
jgi:ABC-type nitrate/sulfonate/bicarbonate transport system substrate-binding protein